MSERLAWAIGVAGLLAAVSAGLLTAQHYPHYVLQPEVLIPESEAPKNLEEGARRSADLAGRYPQDPRAHFYRAIFFLERRDLGDAERELRAALTQDEVSGIDNPPGLKSSLNMMLAIVLVFEGRTPEAKAMAGSACAAPQPELRELHDMLQAKGVCA